MKCSCGNKAETTGYLINLPTCLVLVTNTEKTEGWAGQNGLVLYLWVAPQSSLLGECHSIKSVLANVVSTELSWMKYALCICCFLTDDSSPSSSSSSDLVDCPLGTLIPGSREVSTTIATTAAPMITGVPGVMGATGMQVWSYEHMQMLLILLL